MDLLNVNINIFESDEDEFVERRPYIIRNKPNNLEVWDDTEFFERFRLKKNTVLELLHAIEDQLLILKNRYIFCRNNNKLSYFKCYMWTSC